jgi:ectoine hydroxylase-related dioxygenase (phytanoyl-CoA dioxygenase family)
LTGSPQAPFADRGYLIIPGALSVDEVSGLNKAINRDREISKLWQNRGNGRHQNPNLLITTDAFDKTITHRSVLPVITELIGPDVCFEEFSVMIREPVVVPAPDPNWHRDTKHRSDHSLALRNLSVIYYLTDVDETTHCFSVVPESVDEKRSEPDGRDGTNAIDLHAAAGTAILFNAGSIHDARQRITSNERRTIHIYYGHRDQTALSNHTIFPKRLQKGRHASLFDRPNEVSERVHTVYE